MTDATLVRLAQMAGLAVNWTDATGRRRKVGADTLLNVLAALGLPAGNANEAKDSLARLRIIQSRRPPLEVARAGSRIPWNAKNKVARLVDESGRRLDCPVTDASLCLPHEPGYYRLADSGTSFAVAPHRAHLPDRPIWGIGAQLYALRGGTSAGFGDFDALASFCEQAAGTGADAVAISPVHALFEAEPRHISPYAPSTRLWLNPLYTTLGHKMRDIGTRLVDWPAAADRKWRALRQEFARQEASPALDEFVRAGGERLLAHARFEVLDARFRAQGHGGWQSWPAEFRDPSSASVRSLGANDRDVRFQLFLQWRADESLGAAQSRARNAGMAVGIVTDLAVGMDPGGSHAWSAPQEVLRNLTVGAPPDIFNAKGQNWGLTTLSPHALAQNGYGGFIATLRAAMRHAGGIRLDHAMGLERLWVIPQGAGAADGVYLRYPLRALLSLIALESERHRALVVAEDLGTVPTGFREKLARAHMLGMRVLWFERDAKGAFLPPAAWDKCAAALSTTHDLPTLAGWWSGTDLAWRRRLKTDPAPHKAERERARDRKKLWRMLKHAGVAKGALPSDPQLFADAAVAAIARTPAPLKLIPIEDFVGERQQPNIPGTIDEHPNWRRRLASMAPIAGRSAKRRAAMLQSRQ